MYNIRVIPGSSYGTLVCHLVQRQRGQIMDSTQVSKRPLMSGLQYKIAPTGAM